MTDQNFEDAVPEVEVGPVLDQKVSKSKPIKNLPTDRVSKDTQFGILRAYAKASEEQGRGAVSNNDVGRFANISASSISTCNPFWNDAGLLVREGIKQRPVDAVFSFDQAAEWGNDRPASKLAQILAASWFGKPLLARLSLKPTTVNEALAFLAEECKASLEYKPQVQLLLDYLEMAGLITVDGSMVSKVARGGPESGEPAKAAEPDVREAEVGKGKSGNGRASEEDYHPFVLGLLRKLPEPDAPWSTRDRAKWLQTAANIFDLMYVGGDDGAIEVMYAKTSLGKGDGT
ncbi:MULTISPECIES: hypothetical protein [unclassified Variovorax]|uniref:hypothetical protein n=1 Tax=unclassified Variovorax TaxID=663243 RepID=UPI0008AC437C|nr:MULTISPECIES: hypothetical protein [unclassified Variovorax]SEK07252.1 hypothetical protein SAMN05518853_107292 [Variovorax sp. OK202]SFD49778.1 hypothetical protein SAMN05444746_107292 [Variovorax sp. OK212]